MNSYPLAALLWVIVFAVSTLNIPAAPETVTFKGRVAGLSKDSLALNARFGVQLQDSAIYEFQIDLARKGLLINKGVRMELSDTNEFFDSLISAPKFMIENSDISTISYSGIFMEYAHVPYFTFIETKLKTDTLTRLLFICVGNSGGGKVFPKSCSSSSGMEMMEVGKDTSVLNLSGNFSSVSTAIFSGLGKAKSTNGFNSYSAVTDFPHIFRFGDARHVDIMDVLGRSARFTISGSKSKRDLSGGPFFIPGTE